MIAALKDVMGFSPRQEHSPVEYLTQLSTGEQTQLQDLWKFMLAHRTDLEGVEFSLALVGGIARAFEPPSRFRRQPSLKDIDICIATSVAPYSKQETRVVATADRLLRDYLTDRDMLDEQLAGPDWVLGYPSNYSSVKEVCLKGRYSSADLRFMTKPNDTLQIRPFDIQFAGIGEPNMFKQPHLSVRKTKPYVTIYSTIGNA